MSYQDHFNTRTPNTTTPQSQPIPGREQEQAPNAAGGFAFTIDGWSRLERFLVLGAEGGSYYATEKALTIGNAQSAKDCIAEDGKRVVDLLTSISLENRAISNEPAIFALAMAASLGDDATRAYALEALPKVARTGTHLFHFVAAAKAFRGWGRGLRNAVAKWYVNRAPDRLAAQLLKYQQRDGWSHRDLLRLAHPKAPAPVYNALFNYAVKGNLLDSIGALDPKQLDERAAKAIDLVIAVESLDKTTPIQEVVRLITDHGLTHEMLPTEAKQSPAVWEALLPHMGMTALIRNLATMTRIGLVKPLSDATRVVCERLTTQQALVDERVHPFTVLLALKNYSLGYSAKQAEFAAQRGGDVHRWTPVSQVQTALDQAFYLAFPAVKPTGKRIMYALDMSGSMTSPIAGKNISCAEAVGALSLILASVEPQYDIMGFHTGFIRLPVRPGMSLQDATRVCNANNGGGTDCAVPMLYATQQSLNVDAFVVMTDNETWAGHVHPTEALKQYRQRRVGDAKLAVVAMTPTKFSIADPQDPGMLDFVGFDGALPQVLREFIGERK